MDNCNRNNRGSCNCCQKYCCQRHCCHKFNCCPGPPGPRGCPGAPGEPGSAGATGPAGLSASIEVGEITVGAPGSIPVITNSGTPQNAVFDFQFPPTASMNAYGGMYSLAEQSITLTSESDSQVEMTGVLPEQNMTMFSNTLIADVAGDYQLNFVIEPNAAVSAEFTAAARVNGVKIPQATITKALSVSGDTVFTVSTIVSLAAGDVVDLAVSAPLV